MLSLPSYSALYLWAAWWAEAAWWGRMTWCKIEEVKIYPSVSVKTWVLWTSINLDPRGFGRLGKDEFSGFLGLLTYFYGLEPAFFRWLIAILNVRNTPAIEDGKGSRKNAALKLKDMLLLRESSAAVSEQFSQSIKNQFKIYEIDKTKRLLKAECRDYCGYAAVSVL